METLNEYNLFHKVVDHEKCYTLIQIDVLIIHLAFQITELKEKVQGLVKMYDKVKDEAENRNKALENTLGVSEKFWDDMGNLVTTLNDLRETLDNQEAPALEPHSIREQQDALEVCVLNCLMSFYDILIQ